MEVIGDKMVDNVGAVISYRKWSGQWRTALANMQLTVKRVWGRGCLSNRIEDHPAENGPGATSCPHLRTSYEPALPVFIKPNLAYFHRNYIKCKLYNVRLH